MNKLITACLLLLLTAPAFSQDFFGPEEEVRLRFKKDILILANDAMEGREAGTPGEQMAADFIANRFREWKIPQLEALGSYYQEFEFQAKVEKGDANHLALKGKALKLDEDYYPLAMSENGKISGILVDLNYGISSPDKGHDDYADKKDLNGKIGILKLGTPDADNPHTKFAEKVELRERILDAKKNGLAALLVYNTSKFYPDPSAGLNRRVNSLGLPVVFLTEKGRKNWKKAVGQTVSLEVELVKTKRKGKNVVAYLDRGAANTVVIGAHYDHLGHGDEGSLHRGEVAIHNGADDNASGVAMMLALAQQINSGNKWANNNFMFIGFSGEEKGLLGSNFFCKNSPVEMASLNYMINMDMVGRLDAVENILGVNAVGTSPAWKPALNDIKVEEMTIKTTESGIGASDHTSFYLKDVPAIHFFSGTHSEYHKPSDDEELINYEGMYDIYKYILLLINELDGKGKIAFSKTTNEDSRSAPRFTVTLGVIPDYLFDGDGMRIDGVTDGKTASKAGLKTGDVVVKMGDYTVSDMMSYMKALSKFKKGDETDVTVKRGEEEVKKKVTF